MINVINSVVGAFLGVIFVGSIGSCMWTRSKYYDMFHTMKNLAHDKHILKIEKSYRQGVFKEKLGTIKNFVDKEFYAIKVWKIPLYQLEDVSVFGIYFSILLGLTFTFINMAIVPTVAVYNMINVFLLGILAFISCIFIVLARAVCGVYELRDLFKITLCSYLEYELELYEEVIVNEKICKESKGNQKVYQLFNDNEKSGINAHKSEHHGVLDFQDGGADDEQGAVDQVLEINNTYNEECIISALSVLDEIFE